MKSKKLLVFLIVLMFLTVLIILNSTLFTMQVISINWLTTKYSLGDIKDSTIVGDIQKGGSIFLVNKDEIASSLEKKYEYLNVVSIETKFPNKIVLHCAEREAMYAIKISDDNYVIVDEIGKVLKANANSSVFAGSDLGAKPIKVFMADVFSLNPENFVKGEMIKNAEIVSILETLSKSLRESNYVPTTSKGVFTEINMARPNVEGSVEINFKTRNGMEIVLKDSMHYTTDKFLLGLERYNYYHQEGVVSGQIEVWYNNMIGKIVARYESVI